MFQYQHRTQNRHTDHPQCTTPRSWLHQSHLSQLPSRAQGTPNHSEEYSTDCSCILLAKLNPKAARPATAVVDCTRPAVPAAEAAEKAATAEAVDWVEAVVRLVAVAGLATVKGDSDWEVAMVAEAATGWAGAEDSGEEGSAVVMVAADSAAAMEVEAMAAEDSAAATAATGLVVVAMAAALGEEGSGEAEEERGLAEVAVAAWAEVESCVWRHRTGILYRSGIQLCSCTGLQLQNHCIVYQFGHRAIEI